MAYEFLKKLFGTNEDGTPKALTAEELEAAITADKGISVVDLKAGGYVSQAKYDRLETEKTGLQTQLTEASNKLKSFQTEDGKTIEDIRKEAADWKTKYDTDTKALQDKLSAQERSHLIDQYLNGTEFTSRFAKKEIKNLLEGAKELSVKDGQLVGADDLMKGFRKDYADAFKADPDPAGDSGTDHAAAGGVNPNFTSGTSMNGGNPKKGGKGMSLFEAMKYANEHPDVDPATLF
jgi:hypothetical protein